MLGLSVIFFIIAVVKFRSVKTHRADAELIMAGRADLHSTADLSKNNIAYHKSLRAVKATRWWGAYWLFLALLPPAISALYHFGIL